MEIYILIILLLSVIRTFNQLWNCEEDDTFALFLIFIAHVIALTFACKIFLTINVN
jgi:hypothetical protein